MSERHEGGCFCGAVRYAISGPYTYQGNCHCHDCQRAVGAGVVSWVGSTYENFAVTKGEITFCETSPGVQRGFCGRCGTSLTFGGEGWNEIGVTAASLDEADAVAPESNVYLSEKRPWITLFASAKSGTITYF